MPMTVCMSRLFTQCLSVFPADILKTDIAKITKLDIQMFHDESGNPLILGSKVQGHNVFVGLQTERSITVDAYVSNDGFSHHVPALACHWVSLPWLFALL